MRLPGLNLLVDIAKPSGDGRWDVDIEGVADGDWYCELGSCCTAGAPGNGRRAVA